MLADPQSVTINAVATSLPLTQVGPTSRAYSTSDGNTWMTTKQNVSATRFRREVRLSQKKITSDPVASVNKEVGASVYFVIDEPRVTYFSDTEIGYLVEALKAWLTSANRDKLLGGEL